MRVGSLNQYAFIKIKFKTPRMIHEAFTGRGEPLSGFLVGHNQFFAPFACDELHLSRTTPARTGSHELFCELRRAAANRSASQSQPTPIEAKRTSGEPGSPLLVHTLGVMPHSSPWSAWSQRVRAVFSAIKAILRCQSRQIWPKFHDLWRASRQFAPKCAPALP
jgi:hypothetical protein